MSLWHRLVSCDCFAKGRKFYIWEESLYLQSKTRQVTTRPHAPTAQVIEPIFTKHFEKDPERDFPVLANVHRVARREKHQSIPKNPLDMEFDMGN